MLVVRIELARNNALIIVGDNTKSTVISVLRLLTDLLLTNEPFPVHSYGKYHAVFLLVLLFDLS
jgi:hypothetical protein